MSIQSSLRSRGMHMLASGIPPTTVARQLGVTSFLAYQWRRQKIAKEQRKLWDAVEAVSVRRCRARFTDVQLPSKPNGPAILVDGRFKRDVQS